MKNLCLIIYLFFITSKLFSQTWELPDSIQGEIILKHTYIVSYNSFYKIPNYTAYILTSKHVQNDTIKRTNNFIPDPLLNKKLAIGPIEYLKSGYDKGHMVPADDMAYSLTGMLESFFMTNMCPQKPDFNRGIWKTLENYTREIALQYDSICVITGPIIVKDMMTIGNHVGVPRYFFKIIYIYKLNTAIGFFFENGKYTSPKNLHPYLMMKQYHMSVNEIEELSGLKFFRGLPVNKVQQVKFNKVLNLD